ncbi:MAG: nucleoside triphosphate pyrophosphohydrolase [Clostridia bacterium]|nr:nucleoside triphosphate pyrophosphohydrolase [Clostridia bacterium]MEE1116108.1 nucleoside triphosphate pyrophosphohydrolase [Clostridia bacterium]
MDKKKRQETVDYLTSKKEAYSFDDLRAVTEILRSEGGCPWDMEQTHTSIRKDFIEETYEAIEAIDNDDSVLMREELGDVMFQVMFHARIEEEQGRFDVGDVVNDVCAKLIHRHPHVFGSVVAENTEKVLENWEKIKGEEKTERKTVTDKLRAVPPSLPALMKAVKVGKKASMLDFADASTVVDKLYEELGELRAAIEADKNNTERSGHGVYEELGDLLLTVASLARFVNIDPEQALNSATDKFIDRFEKVENEVLSINMEMSEVSGSQLDDIWNKIKHI